jgi:RNA polymerase sigma-70 factor (ECF subfamily)
MERIHQRVARLEESPARLAGIRSREQALAKLVEEAARGDQTALASLYEQTGPLVYGLALKILGDQFAAEDVTIDVYTQVYQQGARFDPSRGNPSAWLVTLTRSRAIDRLRMEAQRRTRERPLEEAMGVAAAATDPEEWSTASEVRDILRAALAALTPEQRQVIDLAYYAGLTHSEIAARLNQPLGTVKTRIRTGMMILRDHLRPILAEAWP